MTVSEKKKLQGFCKTLVKMSLEINTILEMENERYDNASEKFQDGPKGDEIQENISNLDTAAASIDECIEALQVY